jgi:hypothetical protein
MASASGAAHGIPENPDQRRPFAGDLLRSIAGVHPHRARTNPEARCDFRIRLTITHALYDFALPRGQGDHRMPAVLIS